MGLISRVSSRTYRKRVARRENAIMRTEICQFSGLKIYPGHGKSFIRFDGKKVILINGKSEKLLRKKKNPRKITWTILYRRKHKKGTMTEIDARKRSRRALKTQRGVAGKNWAEIQAMKTVKPEVRKATRDAAIEAAKKKKKAEADKKKQTRKAALARRRRPTSRRTPNRVARVLDASVARGKHLSTNAVFVRLFYLCYDRSTLN